VTGLYLVGLLVSIAGLVVLDLRLRLFLGAAPLRAGVVLAVGVVGFLAWDLAGVHLGVFFEGPQHLLVGVDLARDVPLEELFFLVLLCLSGMEAFALAQRLLTRSVPGYGEPAPAEGER
jgi:lycopene cyclase domain-containing protein